MVLDDALREEGSKTTGFRICRQLWKRSFQESESNLQFGEQKGTCQMVLHHDTILREIVAFEPPNPRVCQSCGHISHVRVPMHLRNCRGAGNVSLSHHGPFPFRACGMQYVPLVHRQYCSDVGFGVFWEESLGPG